MAELDWNTLESKEDSSVNFVANKDGGKIEARFVQRTPDYFIVYLSSHTGCNKSCRMCHLTATGQTYFTSVTPDEYHEQARKVFEHWQTVKDHRTKTVHFNFMARGEPLANEHFFSGVGLSVFGGLHALARENNLQPKFKISTIMPEEIRPDIPPFWLFEDNVQIYYSLYSVNERFRKRWLPKSLPVQEALAMLRRYQINDTLFDNSRESVVFHWAFIEGENDSVEDVEATCRAILDSGVTGKFNLVRYNPPNDKSKESSFNIIERNFKIISDMLGHPDSRIVPRVGFDVKASCGMFV